MRPSIRSRQQAGEATRAQNADLILLRNLRRVGRAHHDGGARLEGSWQALLDAFQPTRGRLRSLLPTNLCNAPLEECRVVVLAAPRGTIAHAAFWAVATHAVGRGCSTQSKVSINLPPWLHCTGQPPDRVPSGSGVDGFDRFRTNSRVARSCTEPKKPQRRGTGENERSGRRKEGMGKQCKGGLYSLCC
jgi:hypothetical protein